MNASKAEFTEFERKKEKFKQDTKHCKSKLKKLQSAVAKETASLATKRASLEQMEAENVRLAEEIEQLTARQQAEEKKLEALQASLKDKTSDIRAAIEAKKQELIPKQKEATELEEQHRLARSEYDMLSSAQQQARTDLEKYAALRPITHHPYAIVRESPTNQPRLFFLLPKEHKRHSRLPKQLQRKLYVT